MAKYTYFDADLNFTAAQQYCQTHLGTDLASIHSDEDQDLAAALCRNNTGGKCWIGLHDIHNEAIFGWLDETAFDYGATLKQYPWDDGTCMSTGSAQPNNVGNEDCIAIGHDTDDDGCDTRYRWNDQRCYKTFRVLCNSLNVVDGDTASSPNETSSGSSVLTVVAITIVLAFVCCCIVCGIVAWWMWRKKATSTVSEQKHVQIRNEPVAAPKQVAVAEENKQVQNEMVSQNQNDNQIKAEEREPGEGSTGTTTEFDRYGTSEQLYAKRESMLTTQTPGTTKGHVKDVSVTISMQQEGEGEGGDKYNWIENTLYECDEDGYKVYLENFKLHKITDETLTEIQDEMDEELWTELIPATGARMRFRKYLRESNEQ